ncbi:MAG: outer membrane beta-barrel protein [Pseudomonadales bacterium]|jgi:opacity protein-like surface antigen|nr:outer membrane beta-barrel protein [Pseudomonadales bacterium]
MNHRITGRAALAAGMLGLLAAQPALADGPNWTWIDAAYQQVDFDDVDEEADVLNLDGSWAATELVHVFAGYRNGEVDTRFGDIDVDELELGIGVNPQLTETVDLYGRIGWATAEIDFGGFDDVDDDGFTLAAGLRAMVLPRWELNGGMRYVDIGDDDTELTLGTVYNFTPRFAVTGDVAFADEATTWGIGVRFYPDRR